MKATISDEVLLGRARRGDQLAFRHLVERYEATVRGIIAGMLGREGVDDVAQEVFLRFYRSLANFKGNAGLGTYLGRIAINTTLNALAKRKKRRWLPWTQLEENQAKAQIDPAQAPERADLREALNLALQRLPEEQRSVVVLRLVEGYSVSETATILNVAEGTVASRLSRAQRALRDYLKPR